MYEFKNVIAVTSYCLAGNFLTVINKVLMKKFPFPFTILLIQCIGTLAFLKLGFKYFPHIIGNQPQHERALFARFSVLTFQFAMMLSSSMFALKEVSVPTFIVIRNLATIITAIMELGFLGRRISLKECCFVVIMLLGAIYYAHNDIYFTAWGYKFLFINVMFSSTYQVYVKTLVFTTNLSPWAMSYYNNFITVIMFAPLFYVQEYAYIFRGYFVSLPTKCMLLLSSFIGFLVSVTGFILNHLISPTAIMVINNVNKFFLIFANEIIFGKSQNIHTLASALVVIISGVFYSLEYKKNVAKFSEEALIKPRKSFKFASRSCMVICIFSVCIGKSFQSVRAPRISSSFRSSTQHPSHSLDPKLYGILEVKDDGNITKEWFRRHLRMFDGIVVFDGSTGNDIKKYVQKDPNVIYTHENQHERKYFTDSENRGIGLRILNANWGTDNWVMICHSDSFYYHDPRSMAMLADRDGADHISWFALHVLPHPTEFKNFIEHPEVEIHKKFRHFHWYGPSKEGTFQEHRMFKNGAHLDFGIEWCSGPPIGVVRLWHKYPAYLHYKITEPSLSNYDKNGRHKGHFQGVKLSKSDPFYKSLAKKTKKVEQPGVGISWHISSIEDFFVDKYVGKPKYKVCTKFDGSLPVELNQFGEEFKAEPGILD